jgi:UDP-3-O-acyl-N-acetylglucosamine deacetylase
MAALAGCGIHNALIDIDGPEVLSLMDPARPFVAGLLAKNAPDAKAVPVRAIRILAKTISGG